MDREKFSTRYKISGFPGYDDAEVVKIVGGIGISGGRPYSPHHRHLHTTIDPSNQSKLKTFLTKPPGSSLTYQVKENWSNYALTRQWGMIWNLTSTIISKKKRNVNGVIWDTISIGTEGVSIKATGRESGWAETEISFSEKRLVEAGTGITLSFKRQWGETANSPAKACDP